MKNSKSGLSAESSQIGALITELETLQKKLNAAKGKQKDALSKKLLVMKNNLGWELCEIGRHEDAIAVYSSIPLKAATALTYCGLGRAFLESNRIDEAKAILVKGIRKFPADVGLTVAIGNICKELNSYEDAIVCYERALVFAPDNPLILFSKANALDSLERYTEAISVLQPLTEAYPDELPYLTQLAYCYLHADNPRRSAEMFKNILDGGLREANIYNGLFCSYIEMEMVDKALKTAKEAFKKAQDADATVYSNLSYAYWLAEEDEMSWKIAKEGISKYPDNACMIDMINTLKDEVHERGKDKK
jgi:tetratricopeptide (TPR) repeat protein